MSRNVGSSSGLSKNSNGSLTSAVSSLVRAQYGLQSQSTPSADTTTDLDKHVAELLLLEAKEKEARLKNSNTQWYFSDDDEDNGKQYQSKTNKRFLKNMLKGVEEHNAPLRRRESEINLEEIRAKERKARELRLGIKDSERLNRSNNTSASASVSGRGERGGPGFAARMLANGLSGALSARDNRTREDRQIKTAIEDARRRADGDRRSDSRDGSSDRRDAEYHSRDVKGKGRQKEEQPIQAGDSDDDRDYRRRRSSRSKDRQEGSYRSSRHRHTRENLMDYSDSEERSRRRRSR